MGEAIQEKMKEKIVKLRGRLFIVSNLWTTCFERKLIVFHKTFIDLKLDCLIHQSQVLQPEKELLPKDDKGSVLTSKITFLYAWDVREELADNWWLMKALGISNFKHF